MPPVVLAVWAVVDQAVPVVEVVLVRGGDAAASCGAAHDGQHRVEERHPEDEDRDRGGGQEEIDLIRELIHHPPADRHRRRGHERDHARGGLRG